MANTEGLPDEAISSLLTLSQEESQTYLSNRTASNAEAPRFPRKYLARREQMMELGEGEQPAAKVIRSSRPPVIRSSASMNKVSGANTHHKQVIVNEVSEVIETSAQNDGSEFQDVGAGDEANIETNHRPVILSDSIQERPIITDTSDEHITLQSTGRKESRFKQRNRTKNKSVPTAGGFPSLDFAPVGSLTRKGRATRARDPTISHNNAHAQVVEQSSSRRNNKDQAGVDMAADSMLANMSIDDIRDGIDEIKSILSPESIEFLRNRKKKGKVAPTAQQTVSKVDGVLSLPNREKLSKEAQLKLEDRKLREDKEKTAQILSSVQTPEDMDRAYNEALSLGLATELPSSTLQPDTTVADERQESTSTCDITMLTSLLRSTALRQRLLGAKGLCSILKVNVDVIVRSRQKDYDSEIGKKDHDETLYPPLLPVALRCLLDDSISMSHTAVGRSILSLTIQSIQYLLMLFVHPHHLVCVNPVRSEETDPFIINQTCFMSEISHIPAGSELYPPTTIEPIGQEGVSKGCYRADSSAASAESDSKAFYSDPAWTLLSRMRIIPCLSDALICISKDISTDTMTSSETSLSSICGILTLLAVRSPGVAAAIAGHKTLLPLIISRCLSPNTITSSSCDGSSIFRAHLALPALKFLCILAQQSRDIAKLETFESIIPDLQAILYLKGPNNVEQEVQTWSLILIRTMLRYGLATNQAQSLIHLSATQMPQPQNGICLQYFSLFSRMCDSAKMMTHALPNHKLEAIPEHELDDSIVRIGVWLSSLAKNSASSIQHTIKEGSNTDNHKQLAQMKLVASQLQFLSSYLSVTDSTEGNLVREEMKSSFVPAMTPESCTEVCNAVLESDMLKRALGVALQCAFCTGWNVLICNDTLLENEAASCLLISSSFMLFNSSIAINGPGRETVVSILLDALEETRTRNQSITVQKTYMHPSRRSWYIEAEFNILKFLCGSQNLLADTKLISSYAFSLLGRMAIGDEAMADFIFHQDYLFQVDAAIKGVNCDHLLSAKNIQNAFLRELSSPDDRAEQLEHSSALHSSKIPSNGHLSSLRSGVSFGGKAENAFLLPLGGIWLWNILSSLTTDLGTKSDETQTVQAPVDLVSHALALLLAMGHLYCGSNINRGTKLYHIANICLYPEAMLRDEFVQSAVAILYKQLNASDSEEKRLIRSFISACHDHSRISRTRVKTITNTNQPQDAAAAEDRLYAISADELSALDDFAGDICDSFVEHGAQYDIFSQFIRLFLRHEFPTKCIASVLSKLHPILNVLTLDEEKSATFLSLLNSVSGGLPSMDNSRRDHSDILDSFADALKKRDRTLSRSDYIYLLAVSIISRNLSSSSQRCECGVEAMKHRLSGIQDYILYDIAAVCEQFLVGDGSKESLINCVLDICLDKKNDLRLHAETVQMEWKWDADNEGTLWVKVMSTLKGINEASSN